MGKSLTVTLSDEVYDGLHRRVAPEHIGAFIDGLARPHVVEPPEGTPEWDAWMKAQYRAQAAEEAANPALAHEIRDWCDAGLDEGLPDDDWTWLAEKHPPLPRKG